MARTNGPIQVWHRTDTIPSDAEGGYAGGDSTAAAVGTAMAVAQVANETAKDAVDYANWVMYGEAVAAYSPDLTWRGEWEPTAAYGASDVVVSDGRIWLASTSVISTSMTRTNHMPNPTFRGGQRDGWAGANVSYSYPTPEEVTLTFTAERPNGVSLLIRNSPVAASGGETWSAGFVVSVPSGAPNAVTVRLNMAIVRPGGNTSQQSDPVTVNPGQTVRVVRDAVTMPETTTGIQLGLASGATVPSGSVVRLSKVILEKAPTVGTYFDGATPDVGGVEYSWTGTPDNSASTAYAVSTPPSEESGWSDITRQVAAAKRGGGASSSGPPRTDLTSPWTIDSTTQATYYPSDMDRNDRQTMISYNQFQLRFSRDEGDTWTVAHTFEDVVRPGLFLDNGEVLVTTRIQDNSQPWEAWLSEGWPADPTTATWTKVLTATTLDGANPAGFASFSSHGPIVVMGEYGPKAGFGSYADGARHVYLSRDYGKTWTLIFDLYTDNPATSRTQGMHLHGVCFDPYWDRIWITFGDDENGTLFSDDLGKTWNVAHYTSDVTGDFQGVGMIALPRCLLITSDGQPNGVWRIDRSDGKHSGTYDIKVAYLHDDEPILSTLCQSIWRANRPGDDAPVVMSFVKAPSGVGRWWLLTTLDGYVFNKVWEDSEDTAANQTGNAFGPTVTGELLFYNYDQLFGPSGRTLRRGPMPGAY